MLSTVAVSSAELGHFHEHILQCVLTLCNVGAGHVMINRMDTRSMMQCLLHCGTLLKQVRSNRSTAWLCTLDLGFLNQRPHTLQTMTF